MKSKLFSPMKVRDLLLRNRIAIPPMCQYSAVDGYASDWHLVHYGSRAVGGAAMIIQEATAVSPEGRITPADLGLYVDAHVEKLKQITSFIRRQGCIAAIQLAHAGRKASCAVPWEGGKQRNEQIGGWETLAPSAIAFSQDDRTPRALDEAGIQTIVDQFRSSAARALQAGYQVVEIHAAHGYLIHQFLSPLSNKREDRYGGSFENRVRLLLEIVSAVREVWSADLPLFVRISATDWAEGGWNPEEAVKLSILLKQLGVDLMDVSSGGLISDVRIPLGPGYQVLFAERIRREANILTSAVGMITEAQQAEDILEQGQADLVLFGRASLREPYLPLQAADVLNEQIAWPLQYVRAKLK